MAAADAQAGSIGALKSAHESGERITHAFLGNNLVRRSPYDTVRVSSNLPLLWRLDETEYFLSALLYRNEYFSTRSCVDDKVKSVRKTASRDELISEQTLWS